MAKETKTIQVYPNDTHVNRTIQIWEHFGWELVSNQHCQDYTGQTSNYDGTHTEHYKTFNKLTFSREKSEPWYNQVVELELEYSRLKYKTDQYEEKVAQKGPSLNIIIAVLGMVMVMPGVLYIGYTLMKKKKFEQEKQEYIDANRASYEENLAEIDRIFRESDALISGK